MFRTPAPPCVKALVRGHHRYPKATIPKGSCSNLRPITHLSATRKTISTVVLKHILPIVDIWLSPSHSGFHLARSTADSVWAQRWNIDLTSRFQTNMHILGIDLSKAFNTIYRHILLLVLDSILSPDEVQHTKVLLSAKTLQLRLGLR